MNKKSIKIIFQIWIISLILFFLITSIEIGNSMKATLIKSEKSTNENYFYDNFNIYQFPEYVTKDRFSILYHQKNDFNVKKENSNNNIQTILNESLTENQIIPLDGLMDSPWPMYCYNARHTGHSPYNTTNNQGQEKWRFITEGWASDSPVIDDEGIIYIGSTSLYAVYPNGTLKWKYNTFYHIDSTPAIDENGVIYFGTVYGNPYLFAIYTNNGTLKWKYFIGNSIFSSPVINDEGTIYFGDSNNNINALYPNGTLKWRYHADHVIYSSPAVGFDGTLYCGSHDGNLYALYPNNGTLKWIFTTGSWVHGSPTIADDGTVYIGSDDGYLYALYPNNGTMKWKCNIGCMYASPTLDENGTLYFGVWEKIFYAIYPNGTVKWTFDPEQRIWGSSATISADGTIYFGTCDLETEGGLDIVALNYDGTLKWRRGIGTLFSSPAIGEDGTLYIGSSGINDGCLQAYGKLDSNSPSAPIIDGPVSGRPKKEYSYTFKSTSPLNRDVYYYIDWGDNTITDWTGPYISGQNVTVNHTWNIKGAYTIKARAKDTDNLWGPWGTFEVKIAKNKIATNSILLRFLERFPILQKLLNFLPI